MTQKTIAINTDGTDTLPVSFSIAGSVVCPRNAAKRVESIEQSTGHHKGEVRANTSNMLQGRHHETNTKPMANALRLSPKRQET